MSVARVLCCSTDTLNWYLVQNTLVHNNRDNHDVTVQDKSILSFFQERRIISIINATEETLVDINIFIPIAA